MDLARLYAHMLHQRGPDGLVTCDLFMDTLLGAVDRGLLTLGPQHLPDEATRQSTAEVLHAVLSPVVAYAFTRLQLPLQLRRMMALSTYLDYLKNRQEKEAEEAAAATLLEAMALLMEPYAKCDGAALVTAIRYCKQLERQMHTNLADKDIRMSVKILLEIARVVKTYKSFELPEELPYDPLEYAEEEEESDQD